MDIRKIREMINNLDPVANKALIEALTSKIGGNINEPIQKKNDGVVSSDVLLDIFNKAVAVLNRKYIEGGTSYIEKYRPYLEKETQEAEDKLNKTWQLCSDGKLDLKDFRRDLIEWYQLNLRNIEIYRKEKK
jgi:hypothetical protein